MHLLLAAEKGPAVIRDGLTAVDWVVAGAVLLVGIAAGDAGARSANGERVDRSSERR